MVSQASEVVMKYLLHLSTLSILVLSVPTADPLAAQQRHRVTGAPDQLLAAFAREPESSAGADILAMLLYNTDYPKARVEALLRGLERLALDGTTERVRVHAAELLLTSGSRHSPDPIPGSFARIERVFQHSKDSRVQLGLVNGMRVLTERKEAALLLEQFATQDSYLAPVALSSLLNMGDEGTAVLKRLHEGKAVRNPHARGDLEAIARHGRLN
jgi:hypothetical protein